MIVDGFSGHPGKINHDHAPPGLVARTGLRAADFGHAQDGRTAAAQPA